MRVTRYFQSCLLIKEGGVRILIDPSGQDAGNFDKFGKLDAVLYTHEHMDHFDPELDEKFARAGVRRYANASTAKQMKTPPTVVKDGQELEINGLKVMAKELPHCLMVTGETSAQNTGYLVAGRLFHSGDGTQISGLSAEAVAVPLTGPDISLKDAYDLIRSLAAKIAVPVHYDFIGTKPEVFQRFSQRAQPTFELKILRRGETADL